MVDFSVRVLSGLRNRKRVALVWSGSGTGDTTTRSGTVTEGERLENYKPWSNSRTKRLGTERVMRVDSIISLVLFLAGLAASPAPSQDAAGPGSHPTIISVSFAEHPDSTDVEVTFSKLVQADVSTLEHPDGLVFDLPECELAHPGQRLVVNRGSVFAVRTAVFRSAPPIAIAGASIVTQSVCEPRNYASEAD